MDESAKLNDGPRAVRAGEELDTERLLAYLRAHAPETEGPLEVEQFPAGFSNLTYLVRAGGREFVLRRPPHGSKVKTAHDMGREFLILSRLRPVSAKVPRPSGTCATPSFATASGPCRASFLPLNEIVPVRRTVPEIARSVVVLPAPFAPRTVTIWPSSTASETPWSARTWP